MFPAAAGEENGEVPVVVVVAVAEIAAVEADKREDKCLSPLLQSSVLHYSQGKLLTI